MEGDKGAEASSLGAMSDSGMGWGAVSPGGVQRDVLEGKGAVSSGFTIVHGDAFSHCPRAPVSSDPLPKTRGTK